MSIGIEKIAAIVKLSLYVLSIKKEKKTDTDIRIRLVKINDFLENEYSISFMALC